MIKRVWAVFAISIKRIFSQPWMALATLAGMIFATALSMSVPLYAGSVYNRIFLQSVGAVPLDIASAAPTPVTPTYPPFSFMFNYDSSALGNKQWQDLAAVNALLKTQSAAQLGLPVKFYARYFATDPMALFPTSVKSFPETEQPLIWSSVAMMDDLEKHINVLEGHFPQASPQGTVEVLVYEDLANELGLQVGEQYNLFARGQIVNGAKSTVTIPVRVAGIFQAKDPSEDYWFIRSSALKDRLMVPEETFANRISPVLSNEIYSAFWFMIADGSNVRPEQAMQMVARIQKLQQQANQALPKISLTVSPVDALVNYQRSANLLTILLFAFSIPIFGLLLAFITMTASMTVERQHNEIAILRSRGAMVLQLTAIAVTESLILGALTLLVSIPLSAGVAEAIGRTRSFLDFTNPQQLTLRWTPTTLYFGLAAVFLSLLARVAPTVAAARDNIVSYKRERARRLRAPLWQRVGLDFWLMLPAGYGLYQLRQSGSIDVLGASVKGDPFTNPLLLMVPALAIVALSLFFLRLLPLAMRMVAWVTAQSSSVGLMMAARSLA
ncbi:MAG TPA: FtsX-like permease family protein, partial [Anaerolineaceae bacterium]